MVTHKALPRFGDITSSRFLVGATLGFELVSVICRWAFCEIVLRAVLTIFGALFAIVWPTNPIAVFTFNNLDKISAAIHLFASILALSPFLLALLNLASLTFYGRQNLPLERNWTDLAFGARPPSRREYSAVQGAIHTFSPQAHKEINSHIKEKGEKIHCRIIDNLNEINAFTIGDTIYLTTALIKSSYLPPVIAHEFGHLTSLDGHVNLALRRLILYPMSFIFRFIAKYVPGKVTRPTGGGNGFMSDVILMISLLLLMLAGGGFGVFVTQIWWSKFWRERDYAADQFAKLCGQRDNLVAYLDKYQVFDVAIPFYRMDKPYNEQRVDRLLD